MTRSYDKFDKYRTNMLKSGEDVLFVTKKRKKLEEL